MQFSACLAEDYPAAFDADTSDIAVGFDVTSPNRNSRRSAMNVAVWSSYLPSDCVRKMIKMGWHKTT